MSSRSIFISDVPNSVIFLSTLICQSHKFDDVQYWIFYFLVCTLLPRVYMWIKIVYFWLSYICEIVPCVCIFLLLFNATHFYIFIHPSACFVFFIVLKKGTVYSVIYFNWHIFAIFLNGKKNIQLSINLTFLLVGDRRT